MVTDPGDQLDQIRAQGILVAEICKKERNDFIADLTVVQVKQLGDSVWKVRIQGHQVIIISPVCSFGSVLEVCLNDNKNNNGGNIFGISMTIAHHECASEAAWLGKKGKEKKGI